MAKQYVLNQSKGFWLLLDAFAYAFTLCILMKFKDSKIQNLNQPLEVQKLLKFKLSMNTKVISVFPPFLAFSSSYINANAHNMFSIMLDLCFKNMKLIWHYLGNVIVDDVVAKYDAKVVSSLLL